MKLEWHMSMYDTNHHYSCNNYRGTIDMKLELPDELVLTPNFTHQLKQIVQDTLNEMEKRLKR